MGNDEVATRWAALLPLHELFHLLNNVDAVHGLYYLLMHAWMVVGTSPTVMRIPSVISHDRGRGADRDHRPAADRLGLGRAVRRPDHGADADDHLLRPDRAVLRAGRGLRAGRHAGAAARAGRRGRGCAQGPRGPLVAGLRRAGAGGRLPERAGAADADGAPGHGAAGPVRPGGAAGTGRWPGSRRRCWSAPLAVVSAREDKAVNWIPRPGPGAIRVLFHDYFGATTGIAVLLFLCAVAALLPPRESWRASSASGSGPALGSGSARFAGAWWNQGGVSLPSVAGAAGGAPGLPADRGVADRAAALR